VRWAHEEAGLPYATQKLANGDSAGAYRDQQPFGQVPAYRDGEVEMFESGAIVMHVAEQSEALMPRDAAGRARVQTWMFCALNTMEIPIGSLADIDIFNAGAAWTKERRPAVEASVAQAPDRAGPAPGRQRLSGRRPLHGRRPADDRRAAQRPRRPAGRAADAGRPMSSAARRARRFQKAMAAQMADFTGAPPPWEARSRSGQLINFP
jgi:glutathione S-transferase